MLTFNSTVVAISNQYLAMVDRISKRSPTDLQTNSPTWTQEMLAHLKILFISKNLTLYLHLPPPPVSTGTGTFLQLPYFLSNDFRLARSISTFTLCNLPNCRAPVLPEYVREIKSLKNIELSKYLHI